MQTNLSPQDLAQKTTDEIINNISSENSDDILNSLQEHYDVLNKTQELQIEFLSDFIKNLQNLQKKDKESLDFLKQRVLNHVLKNK